MAGILRQNARVITLLIYFIVVVILFAVAIYVVRTFLPPEWQKFANVLLIVIAAFVVVYLLLGMVHGGGVRLPPLNSAELLHLA